MNFGSSLFSFLISMDSALYHYILWEPFLRKEDLMTNKEFSLWALKTTQGIQGGYPRDGSFVQFSKFDPRPFDNI